MATAEYRYGNYNYLELAQMALPAQQKMREKGVTVSLVVGLGLVMSGAGREILLQTFGRIQRSAVSQDINSIVNGLRLEQKRKFLEGLGGVILGSTMLALEKGAVDGWQVEEFLSVFNYGISGTPIPTLRIEDLDRNIPERERFSSYIERQRILATLNTNPSFTDFFDPVKNACLPYNLQVLFEDPIIQASLASVLPVFGKAIDQLPSRPSLWG